MTRHRGGLAGAPVRSVRGPPAGGHTTASNVGAPVGRIWDKTLWVAMAMVGVVAIKLPELIGPLAAIRPAMLVAGGGTLLLLARTPWPSIASATRRRLPLLVLAYFGWCVLTVPTSLWPGLGIDTLIGFAPAVLLFLAIANCQPDRLTLEKAQLWWVLLLAVYGIIGQAVAISGFGRLRFGYTYDSNDIAALMAIGFPLAAGLALRSLYRTKFLAIGAVLIIGTTIIATSSRGGVVALVAGAVVFALASRGTRRIYIITALIVGGMVGWATASPQFRARMMSLTNLDQDYNNTLPTGRKAVWERGRGYIRQNPLLGVGVGNFPIAEGQTLDEAQQHGKWSAAHNAYIQAYAELGLPGGTILVVLLVSGAIIGVRYARGVRFGDEIVTRPEYIASVASYAVSGIFLSHAYFSPMFALLGLLALADRVSEVERGTAPVDGTVIAPQPIRIGQRGGLARGSPWPAAR